MTHTYVQYDSFPLRHDSSNIYRAEHAETLSWLIGVPILIAVCVVAGDVLGWYPLALGNYSAY